MSHQYVNADGNWARQAFQPHVYPAPQDIEPGYGPADAHCNPSRDVSGQKLLVSRAPKSKPWQSGWHWRRALMVIMYLGLLGSYATYIYFRIRYTLRVAKDQRDRSTSAQYHLSAYSIFTLCIEVLCMAAMSLFAVNKTFYPAKMWMPPPPASVKGSFKVAVCICCYKETTFTIAGTLAAAAIAIREAHREDLIDHGTAIWLCDDTPAGKIKHPGDQEKMEKGECIYFLEGQEFRHNGTMRGNRRQLIANLRYAFPDVQFVHRLPKDPVRQAEHNGLNKKSGNLNSTLREIWPHHLPVTDRDIMVVLDADQAAFPDFLIKVLPCMDAGIEGDNVALVQSPQVFEGVHQVYDVFAHQNVEFWSTLMVAYNTTGFISCAGTNFAIRAAALRACGPAPFPTHTVTEDFALGMRLRAHNPRFTGIYLPLQLVQGTAPDTIRAAFKQRSRWTKGPFQLLISSESPFWYTAPEGAEKADRLSLRDRLCFFSPVFNAIVNCLATPFYCFVPCFFIWAGRFPASLDLKSIIAAVTAAGFTLFFKFFARPSVGVRTAVKNPQLPSQYNGKSEVQRRQHSFASYVLAAWNADINVRNFWWLFAKVIINFLLTCCGCRGQAGFSATVGGSTAVFDGFLDVLPLALVWLALMVSVTWAALQLYVGARLVGPLGICMAWAIYQAIAPFAMMLYVLCRVRHAPQKRGCCGCYEHAGRAIYSMLYIASFFISWACIIVAAVLAIKTIPRQSAFTQNIRTFTDSSGQQVTYHYFYSVKTTYELLRNDLSSGKNWQWHW